MLSSPRYRRSPRLLYPIVAIVALGASSSALASRIRRSVSLTISRPHRVTVSGHIMFTASGVAPGARRVVFSIDGRGVWSTSAQPYRYRRSGWFDTHSLRDGRHLFAVEAFYRTGARRVARKMIRVRNAGIGRGRAAGGTIAHVGAVGPSPASGPSVANFNRATYLFSTRWSMTQEASRYQVLGLAGNQHALVPLLHALNPSLKILMYQSPIDTNANDYSYLRTVTGCTDYTSDVTTHPNWMLHDQYGHLINRKNSTDHYLMDVGNPRYVQACAANAAAVAKRYGFDGIFFDCVTGRIDWSMNPGVSTPEYPTQASWVAAMSSAMAYLAPALRAQGLLVFGNIDSAPTINVWEQWASDLDGVEEESWTDGNLGPTQQIPYWSQKFAELGWTQAHGKYEILHSYNGTEAGNTYGLAAMLLATSGRASYSTSNTNYTSNENWFPEYSTAQALGAPAGQYRILANGVYERAFAGGIVLVNPTARSIPPFSLGGRIYSGSGLHAAATATMGPTSGLILLKVG